MMQTRLLLVLIFVGSVSTNEHWFIFDQYQFPGFYTPLVSLTSPGEKTLSFALSTYDRSILVYANNETVKLNIERADLLYNTINQLIFVVIRDQTKVETYVNCRLMDSYIFYAPILVNQSSGYKIEKMAENIQHYQINAESQLTQKEIFETFSCKHMDSSSGSSTNNPATTIGRPLIRKMQHVIEKVQRRKLRSRRQNTHQQTSSDSFTLVFKPNIDNNTAPNIIFNIAQLNFHIHYFPTENLLNIRFNNENRTEYLLYADKSADRILSGNNSLVIFLHISSTTISCYVNCELVDQEFILDTIYIQNVIQRIIHTNEKQYDYNRRSTVIVINQPIEQIAANFFCLKLDKKNQDLLPDKYALRKFANALDMLVNSLDSPIHHEHIQNVSSVNIPVINGYGSLKGDKSSTSNDLVTHDKACSTDDDCDIKVSTMKCQSGHCVCPPRSFWSLASHRCIQCQDISLGSQCFRLSNHKSTWYEANDYCQDDEGHDYTMKLASNLNRTDLLYLKEKFLHDNDEEHNDYMYWIGATSHFDTRKIHQTDSRTKRNVPATNFRWYDNGETAQLNIHDLWCSQADYSSLTSINNNQLCVSLTSCGLYADDCQRNYRFLCQAV